MSIQFLDLRVIRASIVDSVKSHFESPPTAMGWSRPYNVYDIIDMANELFVPTKPFVYVISAHAEPTPSRIPMVVVDPRFQTGPYQLGSRAGADVDVSLHCWGRTRAERDDFATMLTNVYAGNTERAFSISIWTSLQDSTSVGEASVSSNVITSFATAGGALSEEGTLRNWAIVSFRLKVR